MEREIYPPGYDANGPTDPEEEEADEDEEVDHVLYISRVRL